MPSLKAYDQELPYSYAPGVFPSLSLMENCPERAQRLLLSEKASGEGIEKLRALCREHHVREEIADKALSRISGKSNCFAAVVFEKWQSDLAPDKPHVVLHHPMDEGNLGTIQRTLLGLGIEDIGVIRPAADPFEPHVVRATMGAIFSLRVKQYDDFADYRREHTNHFIYPFMLDGSVLLEEAVGKTPPLWSLVFGNAGSGLPPEFGKMGCPVRIPHNQRIDSLNLSIAVGIGAYAFVHGKGNENEA